MMKTCTVCGSANLNEFCQTRGPILDSANPVWWCEDCGSMHTEAGVSCPEKSMLHHQVLASHKRFGQSIGEKPHVPDEKTMRFRLSLIAEEFFELLDAALNTTLAGDDSQIADTIVVGWLASQTDMLAEDWEIVS